MLLKATAAELSGCVQLQRMPPLDSADSARKWHELSIQTHRLFAVVCRVLKEAQNVLALHDTKGRYDRSNNKCEGFLHLETQI